MAELCEQSYELYTKLITEGMKPEDARYILPQAFHTTMTITGNYRAWIEFCKKRCSEYAQYEIREFAVGIAVELELEQFLRS
jgi:thymidylate synthase (FAD)